MALNQVARLPMVAFLIAALASPLAAVAQGNLPLQGFWHRESLRCTPGTAPACRTLHDSPADADIAIAVMGDTIVTTRPNRRATFDPLIVADTVVIDDLHARWIIGHRGYTSGPDTVRHASFDEALDTTYHVYGRRGSSAPPFSPPSEKWTVSADGRVLVHQRESVGRGIAVHVVETYHRAA